MDHAWAAKYVGISYDELDCFELCQKVFIEQYGYEVPDPIRDTQRPTPEWVEVTDKKDAVIALFKSIGIRKHLGIILTPNLMLHTERGAGSCIERWTTPKWEKRLLSIWKLEMLLQ